MDFFDHQDTARQRTGLLVFLFSLAVLIITALVSVLSIAIYYGVTGEPFDQRTAITIGKTLGSLPRQDCGLSRAFFADSLPTLGRMGYR